MDLALIKAIALPVGFVVAAWFLSMGLLAIAGRVLFSDDELRQATRDRDQKKSR